MIKLQHRRVLSLVVASAAAASISTPVARADDTDDAYLKALHNHGLTNANGDQGFIDLAHSICTLLADGYTMNAVTAMGELHEGNGLSDDDVKFVDQAAAASYCPQYIS